MKEKNYFKLYRLFKNQIGLLIAQGIFSLIESILAILLINQIADLTDFISNNHYDGFIKALPVSFLVVAIQVLNYFLKKYIGIKFKANCSKDMRNFIGKSLIFTSFETKEKHNSGSIISLFNNQVELIQEFVDKIPCAVINPIITMIAGIYFVRINYKLLFVSCLLIPFSTIIYNNLSKPIQSKSKEIMDEKSELSIIAKDVIDGFYMMKVYGLQQYFSNKYSNKVKVIAQKEKEKDKINAVLGRIFIMLRYIPQLIIPLYGGYLSFINEITLGQLIAVNSIIWYILRPIEELIDIRKKAREIKPALDDIYQIIELNHEENEQVSLKEIKDEVNDLEINNLAFTYKKGIPVLRDINLELKKKEHIKIIGSSGTGKSTLLKIICGLYTEFEGNVKVKGEQLTPANASKLRKLISYIPQHPYIFHDTIEKNISMGKNVSRQLIVEAAKKADANRFIEELPEGYDTIVGSGGVKLSGGQCKRLVIARAFVKEGAIFIFDEPTSALDIQSEVRVKEGLQEVFKEKSSIIVTHRMDLVEQKNKVMLLSEGCLYEQENGL